MEEDLQILFEYKKAQEANTNCLHSDCVERDGVYECTVCGVLLEKEPEPICMHTNDEVLHEGSYVCTGCGLVLTSEVRAEVNWTDRCIIARSYTPIDRLQAVDKHLITFFEKTGVNSPLHPIQEKLRFIKKECKYKSLNYAISLLCILEHDVDSQEKLYPFLPKSNVAWARSYTALKSVAPAHFSRSWLRHLLRNLRSLSKSQLKKFHGNVARLQSEHLIIMHDMIKHYGCAEQDLDSLPHDLRYALYQFSQAILK